jgi:Ion channel
LYLLPALALLIQIREDVIPVELIVLGSTVLVIVTLIHGIGLDGITSRYKRKAEGLRKRGWHPRFAMVIFAGAILLMLFLHLTEIFIWGLVLKKAGLIPNMRDSIYFSANTYTTLGMGPMSLPHSWRELSPIIAICGLFTFAWTTGEMFNIVGYHHDLVADLSARRHHRNASKHADHKPSLKGTAAGQSE